MELGTTKNIILKFLWTRFTPYSQVSAAQSALETAEETNPEAPISDPLPPMLMTGTNPAVYADQPAEQPADQPADQSANYSNEYGSRADPDNTEAPGIPDPVDVLPESESEPEVESGPEVAPMVPVSNLGSPIQTAPDASAPVSPELSEIPETSDSLSDIERLAGSIPDSEPDSPHLPIEASDYETGKSMVRLN